jgi:hypothetical protein
MPKMKCKDRDGNLVWDWALNFTINIILPLDAELDRLAPMNAKFHLHHKNSDMIAGIGFVACQQYINTICQTLIGGDGFKDISEKKRNLLRQGPQHSESGLYIVEAVNGVANYWKHRGEKMRTDTKRIVDALGIDPGYKWQDDYQEPEDFTKPHVPFTDALSKLSAPKPSFFEIHKRMSEWKDKVQGIADL